MNNARIITVASVALCAMGLRAAVPGAATPTWWGVINNHLEARFQKDSGATTTYRAYVKYAGENEFSKLGDVARTSGTGGQIINLAVDGTRPATFRMCGVNADGEGPMSADLNFTATNAVLGTLMSSAPFDGGTANRLANAADGDYTTSFNSKAEDETWIGVDLGVVRSVTGVRFIPRNDRNARMQNAVVEVANSADFSNATTAYVQAAASVPVTMLHTITFATPVNGRYVRWRGQDSDKFLSVAEIEFLSTTLSGDEEIPSELVPVDVTATSDALLSGGAPTVSWTDASSGSFPVLVSRATAAGGPYESVAGLAAGTTSWTDATAALGVRYYYIVQYTNSVSVGMAGEWAAYRRLRRLERTAEDNTKLKTGVTVRLSNTVNEGNASWTSSNAFDGNTNTQVSCGIPDTRIALDFGANKVGVARGGAPQAPIRSGRLQRARVYATDGEYLTTGVQVSDGGFPFSETWVTLTCSDPTCYKVFYLMRPDHVNFFSCMAELELYGWETADEAAILLAPTRLTKTVSASSIALAWDACNRAASYRVEKLVSGAWTSLGTVTSPAFTDSGVTIDGTTVSYRIVSIASGGAEEAVSQTFTFVPYVPADGTGLTAVYSKPYASTVWAANEDTVAVTNTDATIDFDWERANPVPDWPVDVGIYAVRGRWYGKIVVPYAGRYTFKAETLASSAVAVAIDGVWVVNSGNTTTDGLLGSVDLTAGEHDFYAEFDRRTASAIRSRFILKWSGPVTEEVIPSTQFRPVAPFTYGDWTSARTFGDVPQLGMVFPAADRASFRLNHGTEVYDGNLNKYLELARNVKGDFSLTLHAALISPSNPYGQRLAVQIAAAPNVNAVAAIYFIGWSASDNGSGWTLSGKRTGAERYTWNGSWTRRGEFLRHGYGDIRIKRKGDTYSFFYMDPETGLWTADGTVTGVNLPATAHLGICVTGGNNHSADVIWEVANIVLEKISGMSIIIR